MDPSVIERDRVATIRAMRFETTPLGGAMIVELEVHRDDRGGFARTFCEIEFAEHGLPTRFPQCNLSFNTSAGTLRGLHFNAAPFGEAKLVRCVRGAIHDVIVDLRDGSPTRFGWFGVDLSATNGRALFVPAGFAHGFVTLEDDSDVHYHMGEIYRPDAARGLRWDDPTLAVDWPVVPTVISDADASHPHLDPTTFDLTTA